jgi:G3E family GTPase
MVETTGLADPGPVAQTFFVDDEMQSRVALDGIVTLVDAKHIWEHIDDSAEAKEQIAFADAILLNKTDLVAPEDLDKLEARIKSMNSAARIYRTRDAMVDLDNVLNLGGFNLERALDVDPKFLEPEYPFEWSGVYELQAGRYEFVLQPGPDPAMNIVLLPLKDATSESLEAVKMDAVLTFSDEEFDLMCAESFNAGNQLWQLRLGEKASRFPVEIKRAGAYALFTEHKPEEFDAALTVAGGGERLAPVFAHDYKPDHEHDDEVTSVGINVAGDLHEKKLNEWLRDLLMNKGTDIFRMKGVLSIKGQPNRFVFQGVHMLFDGRPDRPWGTDERHNSLIFIGRNLDRAELNEGFKRCLA